MEIEEGEYIRVDNGIILRYDFIQKNNDEILLGQKGKVYSFEDEEELEDFIKLRIIKHSKNIIDLIEVGDIVNGCVVVSEKYTYIEMNFINIDSEISYGWGTGAIPENEIKTILTKEQYKQNSYKI